MLVQVLENGNRLGCRQLSALQLGLFLLRSFPWPTDRELNVAALTELLRQCLDPIVSTTLEMHVYLQQKTLHAHT